MITCKGCKNQKRVCVKKDDDVGCADFRGRFRTEYFRRYIKRIRARAKTIFANRCAACFTNEELEFAHKDPCFLGQGRGGKDRMRGVLNHPNDYILFCVECHREYDRKIR